MCRWCLVSIRFVSSPDFTKERDDIARHYVVEASDLLAEPKRHEAIQKAHALVDRRLAQPALISKIGLIFLAQTIERSRRFLWRLGRLGDASFNKRIDEP